MNTVGDSVAYGKEIGGDILEGKRTLMLIRLLESATRKERERLSAFLGLPRHARSESDVRWVRDRMDAYECIDYARQVAQGLAGAAHHEFTLIYRDLPDSRDKRFIESLSSWVIQRA